MTRLDPVSLVSSLTEQLSRTVTALTPLQSAAGPFLADAKRTDPYPASPQDITLNRAIYALAGLPTIDDPLNPYFDDEGLRERAIRIGAYLAEAMGDTGGIALADQNASRLVSGVHTSGLHSMNFWTCPHTVRYWLQAMQLLLPHLSDPQKKLWRDGIESCLELLANRTPDLTKWPGLQDHRASRLGSVAATAAALLAGGRALDRQGFQSEGERIWNQLQQRLLQSGDEASILDGMDIDALLGVMNGATGLTAESRRLEARLARWRARLTMPDGALNELFDRQRAYSRFGMAAALPALLRFGHTAAAAAVLESFHQRPRRGIPALPELSTLLETIQALIADPGLAQPRASSRPLPHLDAASAMQKMQEQEFGWFGGEASRAWLFRGNGWIAGCRAPIATPAGFSCPWSVRHLRAPVWVDGSAPDLRRLPALETGLQATPATDATKRALALNGDGFHGRFGLSVLDGDTVRLSARIHWALPVNARAPAALQMLWAHKEGDRILIRDTTGRATELVLALEPVQQELPAGAQLDLPAGSRRVLVAVQSSGPPPLLRWNMPARPGVDRLPLPAGRLELLLPFAPGQETRLDIVLSVPA